MRRQASLFKEAFDQEHFDFTLYMGALVAHSERLQMQLFKEWSSKNGLKLKSIQGLSHILEDFDRSSRDSQRIEYLYKTYSRSLDSFKAASWDRSTNKQTIYDNLQDQISWIDRTLKYFKEDVEETKRVNPSYLKTVVQFIAIHQPRLLDIKKTYEEILKKISED